MGNLKTYQHVEVQAQLKLFGVKNKPDKYTLIKFKNGRMLGTDEGKQGGLFHTKDAKIQKRLEKHPDFGRLFFVKAKVDPQVPAIVPDENWEVYKADNINDVKNIISEHPDCEARDLTGVENMMRAANRLNIAFPNLFKDHIRFAVFLEKEDDAFREHREKVISDQLVEFSFDDLKSNKREDLNKLASQLGVKDAEKLPNKEAVIDSILKKSEEE